MTRRVAIIGAGVVGLAASWALERRGFTCMIFEQGAPGGGQSADESRIFRHAHRDPRQLELALRARSDWREWESVFEMPLISPDGSIVIGEEAVARLAPYTQEHALSVRELNRAGIREALPIFAEFDGPAMIDQDSGAIQTRSTLAALINAAGLNLTPETVRAVLPRSAGGVDVLTDSCARTFDAAVVAAGTGTVALANNLGLRIPAEEKTIIRLRMPIRDGSFHQLACLQDSSGWFSREAAYGSPVCGNREYAVGLPVDAESLGEGRGPAAIEDLESLTGDYVDAALPGLDRSRAVVFARRITELPWGSDGLAIWKRGEAFFVAGHNLFKFAPTLGKVLARSVDAGRVESGFRPEDQLGRPLLNTSS